MARRELGRRAEVERAGRIVSGEENAAEVKAVVPDSDPQQTSQPNAAAPSEPKDSKQAFWPYPLLTDKDLEELPDPTWLIEPFILAESFAVLYGEPGVGKSFLALDWALSIAAGRPWMSHKVEQGAVIYVAAEGVLGFKVRVAAWKKHHGWKDSLPCFFLRDAPQLHNEENVLRVLTTCHQLKTAVKLVVFDTMARCFVGGEENSARDMGELVAGCDKIRQATHATVMVVHHTTKAGLSERGSGALRGAADTMVGIKLADPMEITCEKQKDAEPFSSLTLKRKTVQLGDGRSSCVIDEWDPLAEPIDSATSDRAKQALGVLAEIEPATATAWKNKASQHGFGSASTFWRACESLKASGLVAKEGTTRGKYTITEAGRDLLKPEGGTAK